MEPGSTPAVTISELEAALGQIAEVRAARIVASADGRIDEIHVLGLPGKAPKQLVRDVESTLIAGFGITVDRRKISIAQIGIAERPAAPVQIAPVRDLQPDFDPEPEAESDPETITGSATGTRLRVLGVNSDSDSLRVSVRVRIDRDGTETTGEASGPAGTNMRQRLVAEATLHAVEASCEVPGGYAVEEVAVTMLGGRQVAVCSIVTVTAEGEEALSGSAIVRHTVESATVRATLDALNRRIGL
jgi:hypothetical protein